MDKLSIKAQELIKEIDNKRKKLEEQIHLPIPLKKSYVQKYNLLSSRNTNDDILKDQLYDEYKLQEKQAIEQFTKLLKDRNCSYAQVKTFFDQKKFVSQNYFKKRFYHRQFFRFASNNDKFRKSNEQELEYKSCSQKFYQKVDLKFINLNDKHNIIQYLYIYIKKQNFNGQNHLFLKRIEEQ